MKIYAETPVLRARQIAFDLFTVIWTVLWIYAGRRIYELIDRLTEPADALSRAGASIKQNLTEAGERVAGIPLVGEALQGSLLEAAGAGRFLETAGAAQSRNFHTLALWLGIAIAVIPIFLLLLKYLPRRIAWSLEASAAVGFRINEPSLELFALRAVVNLPLYELKKVSTDPIGDMREARYQALAELELTRLGLKVDRMRGQEATS